MRVRAVIEVNACGIDQRKIDQDILRGKVLQRVFIFQKPIKRYVKLISALNPAAFRSIRKKIGARSSLPCQLSGYFRTALSSLA